MENVNSSIATANDFPANYSLENRALMLRAAQSIRKVYKYIPSDDMLEEYAKAIHADYAVLKEYVKAVFWDGKVEFEDAFKEILKKRGIKNKKEERSEFIKHVLEYVPEESRKDVRSILFDMMY